MERLNPDTLLVGWDNSNGPDGRVLVVGRKTWGEAIDIVNAFEGDEAEELYRRLISRSEGGENE